MTAEQPRLGRPVASQLLKARLVPVMRGQEWSRNPVNSVTMQLRDGEIHDPGRPAPPTNGANAMLQGCAFETRTAGAETGWAAVVDKLVGEFCKWSEPASVTPPKETESAQDSRQRCIPGVS